MERIFTYFHKSRSFFQKSMTICQKEVFSINCIKNIDIAYVSGPKWILTLDRYRSDSDKHWQCKLPIVVIGRYRTDIKAISKRYRFDIASVSKQYCFNIGR